ncbi:MAG: MBL fold metallo-hydrolase [Chloroflexales bacterium]|nr:MBL fold metallo-hydrolase [Chloroflexales bacterium]
MTEHMTQLTPWLWVAPSRSLHYNSGAIVSAGQACLIDPGLHPDEIAALAALIVDQGAVLQTIVLTHSHWDHILGPEHLPSARIVTQVNYPAVVQRYAAGISQMVVQWEQKCQLQREQPFVIPMPDETFTEITTLQIGDLACQLAAAPGHATDQLMLCHPESGVLWAADILSDIEIPFVSDSLAAYERTLAKLSNWNIRILVPGHGAATSDPNEIKSRIVRDRAYLAELRAHVEQALRDDLTIEQTQARCANIAYHNHSENEEPHRLNVESVYLELGGIGDSTRMGWSKEDWGK